jgi:small subunit ribosomal protein S20
LRPGWFIEKEIQLPRHKSAEKRMKTAERARQRNRRTKALTRAAVRAVETEKDPEKKAAGLKKAVSAVDKAAAKNVIHKNKASRIKSRLSKATNKQ